MLAVLFAIGLVLVLAGDRCRVPFLLDVGAVLVIACPLAVPVGRLMGTW
jgi:hypothetical protein